MYEDECFICHPEVQPGKGAKRAEATEALMCAEHRVPESECGICHPELLANLKPGGGLKVRLPSPESAKIAGVKTATAEPATASEGISCIAEIGFNQNKLAQITAPVGGTVQEVIADLGSRVEENQVVARIWSASIAEAVAKAVLTHQTLDRERKLRAQRVTPEKDLQEAEAAHRTACQHLRTLGFSEEQVEEMAQKPQERVLLEVRAPFAGEIIERTAVQGVLVEPGKPLFTVADRSTVWVILNLPERALAQAQVGQPVEVSVESLPGETFQGKLTWIGAEVDERSRMARARAEVANPEGRLKARMFAKARILTRQNENALLAPASAIQYVNGQPLVFVQIAEDLFEVRNVRLGARLGQGWEVVDGLQSHDKVVTAHGYSLKSQFLISRLGAGCADD